MVCAWALSASPDIAEWINVNWLETGNPLSFFFKKSYDFQPPTCPVILSFIEPTPKSSSSFHIELPQGLG